MWQWIIHFKQSATEGKNQALVGAIPLCGEYPGPRFEDKRHGHLSENPPQTLVLPEF